MSKSLAFEDIRPIRGVGTGAPGQAFWPSLRAGDDGEWPELSFSRHMNRR